MLLYGYHPIVGMRGLFCVTKYFGGFHEHPHKYQDLGFFH